MFGFFEEEEEQEPIDLASLDTTSELFNRAKTVVDNEIAPALAADGGSVELLGLLDGNTAVVSLLGACAHCPSATITLQYGVQSMLSESIPEITAVKRA